jgi:hypothetical protein
MSQWPSGTATPASIVDVLKVVAGDPPKVRASFAKGRCVRGTYVPSNQAEEITKSQSFTGPSRVTARFSVGGGNPKAADTDNLVLCGFSFRLGDIRHHSDILTQARQARRSQQSGVQCLRDSGPKCSPWRRLSDEGRIDFRGTAAGDLKSPKPTPATSWHRPLQKPPSISRHLHG